MKFLLTGAAALAVLTAPAFAQDSGAYVGGMIGGNWVLNDNSDFDVEVDGNTLGGTEYEAGLMVGLVGGYQVTESVALEIEGTYRTNQVEIAEFDENLSVYGVMANALYLAPLDDTTSFYVGVGAGFMGGEMEEVAGIQDDLDPDLEGGFAYQLKAGIDYELDSGNVFGVGLAYMETDFEVDEAVFEAAGVVGDEFELDYGAFTGFITYKFGM